MTKTINIEISPGELIDRYSIVLIKQEMILDEDKLKSIQTELARLKTAFEALDIPHRDTHLINLYKVNRAIWDEEEEIRHINRTASIESIWNTSWHIKKACAKAGQIGIRIAILNDQRCTLKRDINIDYGYTVLEEKSHM